MKVGLELGTVVGLDHVNAKRQALEDVVNEADGSRLVTRVEDLQHADAGAVIDGRELVEAPPTPGNALEKLHIHLQAMAGLRFLIALPPLPSGSILLIGWQPTQPVLPEQAMDGRAGDGYLMKPAKVIGDPAGAEVILLAQIEDFAHDLWSRGAWASQRGSGAIT
jgi:hypothetical protein